MTETRFRQLINKHLNFLVSKYGYKMKFVDAYPDPSVEDGEVEISSGKTMIYAMKSRFDYALTIKPTEEPLFTQKSPTWILEALSIPSEIQQKDSEASGFEEFLVMNAKLLSTHCRPFVVGDFSKWLDILEYYVNTSKMNYFTMTGNEMPDRIHNDLESYIKSKRSSTKYP